MSFCRLAPHYDRLERLTANRRLDEARAALVGFLPTCGNILSVGEGHGRFAQICLRERPGAELSCLDVSPAMLRRAKARLGADAARVTWVARSIEEWEPPLRYDAIVTCFFLDCFDPATLRNVVEKLSAAATPDAVWLNVDFAVPRCGVWRWRAQAVHFLMYRFFRAATGLAARRLTPPDEFLQAQGFRTVARREFDRGLIAAEVWRSEKTRVVWGWRPQPYPMVSTGWTG